MPYYYVTHPNLGFSATIEAPSTEKARTVFLDYLERQGRVLRSSRQELRRNMVADRVADPSEIFADVNLAYGYEETSFKPEYKEVLTPTRQPEPEVEEVDLPGSEMAEVPIEREEAEPIEPEVPEFTERSRGYSPIQEASLGRYR